MPFVKTYAAADDGKPEVLGLDVLHDFHSMGPVHHPGGMVMETASMIAPTMPRTGKAQALHTLFSLPRARCNSTAPRKSKMTANTLCCRSSGLFRTANHSVWCPDRPDFRIAEQREIHARQQKAARPHVTDARPTIREPVLHQKKKARKNHQKAGEVMIEFTLSFVGCDVWLAAPVFLPSTSSRGSCPCLACPAFPDYFAAYSAERSVVLPGRGWTSKTRPK